VIQQLQAAQYLLRTSTNEGNNLIGTQKTVPMNEPDDLLVAFNKLYGDNWGNTIKAGKAKRHLAILMMKKTNRRRDKLPHGAILLYSLTPQLVTV
jgi:hypothetical protein